MAKKNGVTDDPHGAGQWKIGRSEHGKRVILFRHGPRLEWEALNIHITPERVALWSQMLTKKRRAGRADGGGE